MMKDHKKRETKNNDQENSAPVCFQNDPDIQEEYLLPEQKKEELTRKFNLLTKQKNQIEF